MATQLFGVPSDGKKVPHQIQSAIDDSLSAWSAKNSPEIEAAWQSADAAILDAAKAYVAAAANRTGINALDYGAAGDGISDDTTALTAAASAAKTAGKPLVIPAGVYRTTSTVVFPGPLYAGEATIQYAGSGSAVVLGSDVPGAVTFRRTFEVPRVECVSRISTVTTWDGTSVGVTANNLNSCFITVPFVRDFEQGLVLCGNDGGMAYNTVQLGTLWENHKNLVLTCTTKGYVNQNLILGGRLQLSYTRNQVKNDTNAVQVTMVAENPEGGPNNNTLINTSLESDGVPYYFLDIAGSYNQFLNCRWEAPNSVPRIRYRSSALRNLIQGGYNAHSIAEVFDGTQGGGELRDTQGAYMRAVISGTQSIPDSAPTPVTAWGTGVGRRCDQDTSTGTFTPRPGRWRVTLVLTFSPNSTGRRAAYIKTGVDGSGVSTRATSELPPAVSPGRTTLTISTVIRFDGKTRVWAEAFQTTGSPLTLETSAGYGVIELEYLGP